MSTPSYLVGEWPLTASATLGSTVRPNSVTSNQLFETLLAWNSLLEERESSDYAVPQCL